MAQDPAERGPAGLKGGAPAATAPAAWRDLRLRVASAAVIAPVGLAALWFGGLAWNVLVAFAAIGMAVEWWAMNRTLRTGMLSVVISGLCYIGPACAALVWMRDDGLTGRANVLFVMLVVWASDIGAYVAGRLFGGPKLAPSISPGKTWSGAAGGLVSALAVGFAAAMLDPGGILSHGVLVAGALGVVSQLGDLLESAIKRRCGVKDSGHLIPGHGGLLDRLDGMLMAAPLAAVVTLFLGRGVLLWQ